jgi:hypothetical protein
MDSLNFVYWLQGFLELSGPETMTAEQVATIKQHIALVLEPVTQKKPDPGTVLRDLSAAFGPKRYC